MFLSIVIKQCLSESSIGKGVVDSDNLTVLFQYRESYVSETSAVWWVKVDVTTVGKTIRMYYGNVSAPLRSSGDNTFPFFDDFIGDDDDPPDSTKWDVLNATYSKIDSNRIINKIT